MNNEDDTTRTSADDSIVEGVPAAPDEVTEDGVLHVYEAGELTVLGFDGKDVPSSFNVAHYRDAIIELSTANNTKKIAFDLTGVQIVPSGILGLWASLNQHGISIEVYNPSPDIVDVLEITKLNQIISVKHVDIER